MQPRKSPLGRGLDVLIPSSEMEKGGNIIVNSIPSHVQGDRVRLVPLNTIVPNRLQPRKTFDEEKITELCESIKEQGVIQPLIVNQAGPNRFELIAGERRLRAARSAGLTEVPVIVKNVNTESMLELAIIENIQREDLNPLEEATAMKELMNQFDYTQEEVAKRLGKTRTAVANSLRLLNLPKLIQDDVTSGRISAGHARAILGAPDLTQQLKIREKILNSSLTVRDVERMIGNLKPQTSKGARKTSAQLTPQIKYIQDEITKKLATKIRIEPDKEKKGGRVVIDYYTLQDLDRIYNVIIK